MLLIVEIERAGGAGCPLPDKKDGVGLTGTFELVLNAELSPIGAGAFADARFRLCSSSIEAEHPRLSTGASGYVGQTGIVEVEDGCCTSGFLLSPVAPPPKAGGGV